MVMLCISTTPCPTEDSQMLHSADQHVQACPRSPRKTRRTQFVKPRKDKSQTKLFSAGDHGTYSSCKPSLGNKFVKPRKNKSLQTKFFSAGDHGTYSPFKPSMGNKLHRLEESAFISTINFFIMKPELLSSLENTVRNPAYVYCAPGTSHDQTFYINKNKNLKQRGEIIRIKQTVPPTMRGGSDLALLPRDCPDIKFSTDVEKKMKKQKVKRTIITITVYMQSNQQIYDQEKDTTGKTHLEKGFDSANVQVSKSETHSSCCKLLVVDQLKESSRRNSVFQSRCFPFCKI